MKKAIHLLLAGVLVLGAVQASARTPVPVVNHENVTVQRASGQPASRDQVRKAILAAAEATGRKWIISEPTPGRMLATYQVRTHTVVTEISYSATQFSVKYSDSVNMKFTPGGETGTGTIHPFYNQWVQDFVHAVRMEMNKI